MRVLCMVFVVACGRLGFDANGDAASSGDGKLSDGAMMATCIPASCAAAGGTCGADGCDIVAGGPNVTCPGGQTCVVSCSGMDACSAGTVTCPATSTCVINCTGQCSCGAGTIDCRGAACDVHCVGMASCGLERLACSAGTCAVHCCGPGSCVADTIMGPFAMASSCP